jgi:hypothetical protein
MSNTIKATAGMEIGTGFAAETAGVQALSIHNQPDYSRYVSGL